MYSDFIEKTLLDMLALPPSLKLVCLYMQWNGKWRLVLQVRPELLLGTIIAGEECETVEEAREKCLAKISQGLEDAKAKQAARAAEPGKGVQKPGLRAAPVAAPKKEELDAMLKDLGL